MSIRSQLIHFLDKHTATIISSWQKKTMIADTDKHKDKVYLNGRKMFELVKQTIEQSLSEQEIRDLAYKVAFERVEADMDISDFAYNVNAGRSVMMKWLICSKLPVEELMPVIDEVNKLFDQFTYFAVKKFTEMKEAQLQEKSLFIDQSHKERLTILGQMSSSFVHEFRNPLTTILGFTKLLKNEYPSLKYIDIIEHELHQLNSQVTKFLHTSKKELIKGEMDNISLKKLFQEIMDFIYPSLVDGDVAVAMNIDSNLHVYANKEELRQVFMNILLNSIDALKEIRHQRNITINCEIKDKNVHIFISNNGPTIPQEIMDVIFEPFFTTKELGTGIGLYICKKIIESHQGNINCKSTQEFTTFTITLPLLIPSSKEEPHFTSNSS